MAQIEKAIFHGVLYDNVIIVANSTKIIETGLTALGVISTKYVQKEQGCNGLVFDKYRAKTQKILVR